MNGQRKTSSLVEALVNIVVGMGISFVLCQWLLHAPITTNAAFTAILTLASIVRQFVLRRIFNKLTTPGLLEHVKGELILSHYATPRKTRAPWCNVTPDERRR